jgi:hypothetical protein
MAKLLLILIAAGISAAVSAGAPPGGPPQTTLERLLAARTRNLLGVDGVMGRFKADQNDVPTIVARLANEQNVLCGIAVVPHPTITRKAPAEPPFKRLNVDVDQITVRAFLDSLVQADPTFEWREDHGVINVALRSTFENKEHPLNTIIPHFEVDNVPLFIALFGYPDWDVVGLFRTDDLRGHLPVGAMGSGPGPEKDPPVSVSANNKTLLQILNEMAREMRIPWCMFDTRLVGGKMVYFLMTLDLPATPDSSSFVPRPGSANHTAAPSSPGPSAAAESAESSAK